VTSQPTLFSGERAQELEERRASYVRLLFIACFVWPPFCILDVFGARLAHHEQAIPVLLTLRIVGTVLLLATYRAVRWGALGSAALTLLDVGICIVIGIIVSIIGVEHAGVASRDFAGVMLLITTRAALVPSHWKRGVLTAGAAALTWPAVVIVETWVVPEVRAQWAHGTGDFIYGWIFIMGTLGMCTAGGHALWVVRREARAKSREIVENRAELATKVAQLAENNVELRRLNEELAVSNHRADRIFTALAEALPGKVLDGKYQLRDRIGAGGFGVVFSATHLVMRRPVAVKVFRPTPGNDSADALERFRREAISACLVQHPNAIAVYDSGISAEQIPYLAMELLEGESLATLLAREKKLDIGRCLTIAKPVCDALQVAHDQGIVHRDVKPENVFLHNGPSGEIVKVVDFGIAALLHTEEASTVANKLTATNVVVGTPAYVAPERVMGEHYDGRADVYSVGVMIYEMLTGHLPIEYRAGALGLAAFIRQATQAARPLSDWLPGVPDEIETLVMRVLAREPSARPTAGELASELRRLEQSSMLVRAAVSA
jgi:hypothetical protein